MLLHIDPAGVWYHGSNVRFGVLRACSTVTQWRALAEAFSHQPSRLSYSDEGEITHNGTADGILYIIDEPVAVGVDIYLHPRTTMSENAEFLTSRDLRVKAVLSLPCRK